MMMDFKSFVEQQVAPVSATTVQSMQTGKPRKPWKAHKADVIDHWKNLTPNMPIKMEPVSEGHKGSKFRSDGIRVTGSPDFINSVMSRFKDLASYETAGNRLEVEYRQIETKQGENVAPEYVFYCHLVKTEEKPPKVNLVKPEKPAKV
jgi:hypothetical protein